MTNGILWLRRIFEHYNEKISFLKETKSENKAAVWMKKQYCVFERVLLDLLHSDKPKLLKNNALRCLLHFVVLQQSTHVCEQILVILLFDANLSNEQKSIFSKFVYESDGH